MNKELESTFIKALDQHQSRLLRICSVYAKDEEDTKDLYQEVLIHVWQSMPRFEAKASIGTWMYRITLNVCLRFRAKQSKKFDRFVDIESVSLQNSNGLLEQDEQLEKLESLRSCIRLLNEADKAIVLLYLEELSYKEISTITGLSENNIAVRVKRIKIKLMNCINNKEV